MWRGLRSKALILRAVGQLCCVAVSVLLTVLGGCATAPQPASEAEQVPVGFPAPGTQFSERHQKVNGARETRSFTVLEDGDFRGRRVRQVAEGTRLWLLDWPTTNFVALVEDGKLTAWSEPHLGTFNPPLWVGKRWTARRMSYDVRWDGAGYELVDEWEVDAYEPVTVPAGTFKALRLRSSPGRGRDRTRTIWYAPEIRLIVKEESQYQTYRSPDDRLAKRELVEFRPR